MHKKITSLLLVPLLFAGTQVCANQQDIDALNSKVSDKVAHIQNMTNQLVVPDALETQEIKMKLIGAEIMNTGASIDTIAEKYQLDETQTRQVVIIVYTGGDGLEPE